MACHVRGAMSNITRTTYQRIFAHSEHGKPCPYVQKIMNRVLVRTAQAADIPSLIELLRVLFSIEADFQFDHEKQQRGLELLIENSDERCVFVAETEGEVVGMCSVQTLISTAQGAPKGWIEDVCVDEKYRGRGVGKMLLQAVDDWCLSRGIRGLQLLCDTANAPAQKFYEHLGWQPTQLQCLTRTIDEM